MTGRCGDDRRDRYLRREGVKVVRIAAAAVLQDPHAVAHGLRELAAERMAARP
jgi:very-short-patch-repair endonuclease